MHPLFSEEWTGLDTPSAGTEDPARSVGMTDSGNACLNSLKELSAFARRPYLRLYRFEIAAVAFGSLAMTCVCSHLLTHGTPRGPRSELDEAVGRFVAGPVNGEGTFLHGQRG